MSTATITGMTQYLTYTLADEVFALDIGKVREVLDFTTVTKVPNMPDFMLGVINLRGSVVPVVDLRTRFRMPRNEQTVNTCIIITEVRIDGDTTVLGCLADSVQEVLDLEANQVEPAPKIGTKLRNEFIQGMGKHGNRFIIILDIDKVFTVDDVALVAELGAAAECPLVHHQAA
ncbi:MAG: chemotaxis protein CheW [Nitrospirota bacterium]|nr:chemotaxis protein CheW [Nitrospirota bacterium]